MTQENEESETDEQMVCPECGGNLASDTERGEAVCGGCGFVVEEDEIDPGPEWRAFDFREEDEGLSTNIGWQGKDVLGNGKDSAEEERKKDRTSEAVEHTIYETNPVEKNHDRY